MYPNCNKKAQMYSRFDTWSESSRLVLIKDDIRWEMLKVRQDNHLLIYQIVRSAYKEHAA